MKQSNDCPSLEQEIIPAFCSSLKRCQILDLELFKISQDGVKEVILTIQKVQKMQNYY